MEAVICDTHGLVPKPHHCDQPPKRPQRNTASRPELNTSAWQRRRASIRHRDGNQCVRCGSTTKLSVHHRIKHGPSTPENLETLCSRCHRRADA